jgi:hypothetical protein
VLRLLVEPTNEETAMLGMKTYPQDYVDACRRRVAAQVAAYRELSSVAGPEAGSALAAFEPELFNNLVLVLDSCFVHRLRTVEGKDGNPLNEVRVVVGSLLLHGGVMTMDKAIKLRPETSVLGLAEGDTIALTEGDFGKLAEAYFAEIERRFVAPA